MLRLLATHSRYKWELFYRILDQAKDGGAGQDGLVHETEHIGGKQEGNQAPVDLAQDS